MTALEAPAQIKANPKLWARPVTWRGACAAITYHPTHDGRHFAYVPTPQGGVPATLTTDILEEWEVVDPQVVLRGE